MLFIEHVTMCVWDMYDKDCTVTQSQGRQSNILGQDNDQQLSVC